MAKSTNPPVATRPEATVEFVGSDDLTLLNVTGLVDERFKGFGPVNASKTVVINVAGITRMTSFGVRQWLKAIDSLPKAVSEMLLVGCPTFFVDQLNMVLNFGGSSKVLTVSAPYTCPSCGVESSETLDVLKERANLASGGLPEKECTRCGGKLEFDETPSSYFSFVAKYGASSVAPATAAFLATQGLYAALDTDVEKPPRIIKLVYGAVTYFRISGRIAAMFRARPFLVGAEGEVVLDLAEVDTIDPVGQKEWQRLLKSLSAQVPAVTLIDLRESLLPAIDRSLDISANIAIGTLLIPYLCLKCGRRALESKSLAGRTWPPQFEAGVCSECKGTTRHEISGSSLVRLKTANTVVPPATEHMIQQRHEILRRTISDANTPPPSDFVSAAATDDTILGKYKIIQRLPSTGIAEVFLAKQVGIGGFEKPVVLKRIERSLLERQETLDLMLAEVNRAARLSHPNIVQILDVGEVDDTLYVATEYVPGQNLRNVLERLATARVVVPLAEACQIARDVAQAVDHAYAAADIDGQPLSVIHGDLSPHNIIIRTDGTVKVSDFGVAIAASEHVEVEFMAPELVTNGAITHRSDLFSIGMLLYNMCSGSTPSGVAHKDKKPKAGKVRPLHEVANVPPALSALVSQLLSTNPDERPSRGAEVALALAEITRNVGLASSAANVSRFLADVGFSATDAPAAPPPADRSGAVTVPAPRASQQAVDSAIAIARASSRDLGVRDPVPRHPAEPKRGPRAAIVVIVAALIVTAYFLFRYLVG